MYFILILSGIIWIISRSLSLIQRDLDHVRVYNQAVFAFILFLRPVCPQRRVVIYSQFLAWSAEFMVVYTNSRDLKQ